MRSRGRDTSTAPADDLLLDELQRVYGDADRALHGWSCESSTDCCRFAITGREPYVTSIELAAIERAVARRGGERALAAVTGRRPGARRALPVQAGAERERRCPLLTPQGRCTVYAWRPLGCRTFYCDRATPGEPLPQAKLNELVRRVQEIAARHQPDGDRGRPLTRALP
jgi:Fe-S-cluster containining protein